MNNRNAGREPSRAAPSDIANWQAEMRAAFLDSIDTHAIREIVGAVAERAKKGDLAAARLILSYAIGNAPRAGIEPAEPDRAPGSPTLAPAGSREKIEVLARRVASGLPIHHNGDGGSVDLS